MTLDSAVLDRPLPFWFPVASPSPFHFLKVFGSIFRGWHVSSLSFALFHSFLADVCLTFRKKTVRRWSILRVALWNGRALDMVKHENTFDISNHFLPQ